MDLRHARAGNRHLDSTCCGRALPRPEFNILNGRKSLSPRSLRRRLRHLLAAATVPLARRKRGRAPPPTRPHHRAAYQVGEGDPYAASLQPTAGAASCRCRSRLTGQWRR
jgi:hypothetical protein